ncbi:hypothetical protein [Candidatus Tisiphia endosymbiont of Nemotelus uliginosus]|uniref:hypothetical protein n=1 Tax=Candidatus Tisiphia endosymbiont of Nemotelus uliginosus TaxID=3077926 RepID=UPI0035C923F6
MQLKSYFTKLAVTAFGPWLTQYKNFFTEEDLAKGISSIQEKLAEIDKDDKIVITSNDVIKIIKTSEAPANKIQVIEDHTIMRVLTAITNVQLQKFSEFVLGLPVERSGYTDYLRQEELKDGYSKIEAVKNIPDINKLVEKFNNSPKPEYRTNYEQIKQGVENLQKYISSCPTEDVYIPPLGGDIMDQCGDFSGYA